MSGLSTQRLDASPESIAQAAAILRQGGTVAFPTETVYGLGANALDPAAVAKIFEAKQRPAWDPLIVHVADREMLDKVAVVTPIAERLIAAFWPGALTLLLERKQHVPDAVTAGRTLVGVRIPSHPVALALLRAAGVPVAAPSANSFGHTSPTTAAHVLEDLEGRIDAVVDGGATDVGVESTVLDPNQRPMLIYRPGAVTAAMLEPIAGPASIYRPEPAAEEAEPQSLPSPGVGIRHYAPRAMLQLVAGEAELYSRLADLAANQIKTGVMLPKGWTAASTPTAIFPWGAIDDPAALAHTLFAGIRELDSRGVAVILCPLPAADGVGLAIRDRLEKAAKTK